MGLKLIAAAFGGGKNNLVMTLERRLTDDPSIDSWAHGDCIIGPPRHKEIESTNDVSH
jgi:hypothetical protein